MGIDDGLRGEKHRLAVGRFAEKLELASAIAHSSQLPGFAVAGKLLVEPVGLNPIQRAVLLKAEFLGSFTILARQSELQPESGDVWVKITTTKLEAQAVALGKTGSG